MGSTRLPFKVLLPFYHTESIIEILIRQMMKNKKKLPLVLATSTNSNDEVLCKLSDNLGVDCFCGPENDVLERFILAAEKYKFDRIIRICADNPFFDIEGTMDLLDGDHDYIAYRIEGDVPSIKSHLGFWGEVVSLDALKKVRALTNDKLYREHVTNYIYSHPDHFRIKWVDAPSGVYYRGDIRLTIDDEIDFNMGRDLFQEMKEEEIMPIPEEIIPYLDKHPHYLETMRSQIKKYTK